MRVTIDEIDSFHNFALEKVRSEAPLSLEEIVNSWRLFNPSPQEHAENVAAIRGALRDMENGDHGRPSREIIDELRIELESAELQ